MKRWLKAVAFALVVVVVISLLLAALVGRLLEGTDASQLPLVVWLLGGPLIGLVSGHGLIFYIVAISAMTLCLAVAAVLRGGAKFAAAAVGLLLWCLVGWAMY